ncbi:MAG: hypothetical protein WDN26_18065 [Chitinophagaceae bacterium]
MSKKVTTAPPKKNLKITLILFLAIVIGIFLFMLASVLIIQTRGALMPDLNKNRVILIAIITAISFACLLGAKVLMAKGVAAAKNSLNPLNDKLNEHRSALIKYLVICEMPVMLGIILFLLTGDFIFQVFAAVFIGFMLSMAPTKKRVTDQLQLDWQQQGELK